MNSRLSKMYASCLHILTTYNMSSLALIKHTNKWMLYISTIVVEVHHSDRFSLVMAKKASGHLCSARGQSECQHQNYSTCSHWPSAIFSKKNYIHTCRQINYGQFFKYSGLDSRTVSLYQLWNQKKEHTHSRVSSKMLSCAPGI